MTPSDIKTAFTCAATIFGLLAALLWLFASYQTVAFDPEERDEDGLYPAAIIEHGGKRRVDVLKTAKRQTRWNAWAALAASAAAVCQVVLLWLL